MPIVCFVWETSNIDWCHTFSPAQVESVAGVHWQDGQGWPSQDHWQAGSSSKRKHEVCWDLQAIALSLLLEFVAEIALSWTWTKPMPTAICRMYRTELLPMDGTIGLARLWSWTSPAPITRQFSLCCGFKSTLEVNSGIKKFNMFLSFIKLSNVGWNGDILGPGGGSFGGCWT